MGSFDNYTGKAEKKGSALDTVKSIFKRIGIHALALFGGMLVNQISNPHPHIGWMGIIFTSYAAIVCLWSKPRHDYSSGDWYIPFASGIITSLLSVFAGATLPASLVLGGMCSFFSRLETS